METSPSIAALAKALVAFQGEATSPAKKRTAKVPTKSGGEYSYKYADLSDILADIKLNLKKNNLSVVQSATSDGNGIGVQTMLIHDSGEWIKSDPLILPLQAATPQAAGSAVTYARRYALSAILGISTEEDDDAGSAQGHQQEQRSTAAQRPQAVAPPTAAQPAKAAPEAAPQAPGGAPVMPIGKYTGKPMADLPYTYLEWARDNMTRADAREMAIAEIERRDSGEDSMGAEVPFLAGPPYDGDAA